MDNLTGLKIPTRTVLLEIFGCKSDLIHPYSPFDVITDRDRKRKRKNGYLLGLTNN
jgi:hypothetical protein